MKKTKSLVILLFCLKMLNSQVVIGDSSRPLPGSVLQLKEWDAVGGVPNSKKGLGLPKVELTDLKKLKMGTVEINDSDNGGGQYNKHIGLVVYNVYEDQCANTPIFKGIHVWNGQEWLSMIDHQQNIGRLVVGSNVYKTRKFGNAGTWMIENLRETKYSDGTSLELGTSAAADKTKKYYNYPKGDAGLFSRYPSYGLVYSWAAATNGKQSKSEDEGNMPSQTKVQGICPTGWHLPSDYEWSKLEEEIIKNPHLYSSSNTSPFTGDLSGLYTDHTGNPPVLVRNIATHGENMKSICPVKETAVGYGEVTNGISKIDGFNVLLVGYYQAGGNYGGYSVNSNFWTSSYYYSDGAWARYFNENQKIVERNNQQQHFLISVRCVKAEN